MLNIWLFFIYQQEYVVNQSDHKNEQHRHLKAITKVYKAFWVDMELQLIHTVDPQLSLTVHVHVTVNNQDII